MWRSSSAMRFVTDKEGLKVLDTTNLATPRLVKGAQVPLTDAHNLYVARTYAYVAGGKQGLVIVDVEKPEHPRIDQVYNADGKLVDTRDVKIGMTAASAFAYVADGAGGMKIVQIFAPNDNPNYLGFSPRPDAQADCDLQDQGPGAGDLQRASIAIAQWMKAATSCRCSTGAGRVRSTSRRWNACTCTAAKSIL